MKMKFPSLLLYLLTSTAILSCNSNATTDKKYNELTEKDYAHESDTVNGETIYFRVAFKPVATVMREQDTVNTKFQNTTLKARGRHDPCVLPRAVPMVEAMTALVLVDHGLRHKAQCE